MAFQELEKSYSPGGVVGRRTRTNGVLGTRCVPAYWRLNSTATRTVVRFALSYSDAKQVLPLEPAAAAFQELEKSYSPGGVVGRRTRTNGVLGTRCVPAYWRLNSTATRTVVRFASSYSDAKQVLPLEPVRARLHCAFQFRVPVCPCVCPKRLLRRAVAAGRRRAATAPSDTAPPRRVRARCRLGRCRRRAAIQASMFSSRRRKYGYAFFSAALRSRPVRLDFLIRTRRG